MPYKVQPTAKIKRLTSEVQAKERQLLELEAERAKLRGKHALLSSTLRALSSFASSSWKPGSLTSEEELLLQTLDAEQCISDTEQHTSFCTIAPPDDPLCLLSSLPSDHGHAPPATVEQLRADYQHLASTFASHAALLSRQQEFFATGSSRSSSTSSDASNGTTLQDGSLQVLETVQQLMSGYWASLNSVLLAGLDKVVHTFILSNVVTGERVEQHNTQLYGTVVAQLQLHSEQQQRLLSLYDFYKQLLQPVVAARQQLQQQLRLSTSPVQAGEEAAAVGPVAAAAAVALSQHEGLFKLQKAVLQQQEQLWEQEQQQQQQLKQLNLLMKEHLIKFCACTCMQGCLTWPQIAQVCLTGAVISCGFHQQT